MLLRRSELDLLRIQEVGLRGIEDPEILAWAAENDRIVLTHDRATMPDFAYERLVGKQKMAGTFLVGDRIATREAIDELLLLDECSEMAEWLGVVLYLPL